MLPELPFQVNIEELSYEIPDDEVQVGDWVLLDDIHLTSITEVHRHPGADNWWFAISKHSDFDGSIYLSYYPSDGHWRSGMPDTHRVVFYRGPG